TLTAAEDELLGIAKGLKAANAGVLQFVSDFREGSDELDILRNVCRSSGRPLSVSLAQTERAPLAWRGILGWVRGGVARGLPMLGRVAGRPVGLMLGFDATLNPFVGCDHYRPLADLPLAERVAELRKPHVRQAILDDVASGRVKSRTRAFLDFEKTFLLG